MTSKSKGNTCERWAATLLSEWYGQTFKRIPSSGALRWGGVTDHFGDLLTPEDFKAVIECKHRKNFDLLAVLTKKPGKDNLLGWIQQAVDDAKRCYTDLGVLKVPIAIMKGNRVTPVIAIPENLAFSIDFDTTKMASLRLASPYIPTFYMFAFDTFLKEVSPANMKKALAAWDSAGTFDWEMENGSISTGSA